MNYYERHLGDYSKNTGHLSLLEHGVYVRLIDVYYIREAPIPEAKAARLIGAATPETLQALQEVLQEFFILRDGHWHQDRCDEEIAAYLAGEPERQAKKANEDTRLKRHREERAALFKKLTDTGRHAPWNIKIEALRKLVLEPESATPATQPETAPATPETKPATEPETLHATATATPATATQSPPPTSHSPDKEKEKSPIPPKKGKRSKSKAIELTAWLDVLKASGEKPIPENDPVFTYATSVGIPIDFLRLAWLEFRHKYTLPNAKRYVDWRAHFRNAVRENWGKLWYLNGNGYQLTTAGLQAQRAHEEKVAA